MERLQEVLRAATLSAMDGQANQHRLEKLAQNTFNQ